MIRSRTHLIWTTLALLFSTLACHAVTSPVEDIAETWSSFLLSPKPEQDSIANKKALFFNDYPDLVKLREITPNTIDKAFPQ